MIKGKSNLRWNSKELGQFIWMAWHIVIWIFNYQKVWFMFLLRVIQYPLMKRWIMPSHLSLLFAKSFFGYAICLRHFKDPPRDTRCCLLQLLVHSFFYKETILKSFLLAFGRSINWKIRYLDYSILYDCICWEIYCILVAVSKRTKNL